MGRNDGLLKESASVERAPLVDRAIEDAAFILERIDTRWPTIVNSFSAKDRSLTTSHFLGHVQQEFAVLLVGFGQQTAKFAKVPRIFSPTAPSVFLRRTALEQIGQLRRL